MYVASTALPALSALSIRLREGTKASHAKAEKTAFIRSFLKGQIDRDAYGRFLISLYHVYSAMEEELERRREHPCLSRLDFPELHRKASLERDLAFFHGPDWRRHLAPSPAARAYVQHLREVSSTTPELLVAHCYTRYLGDLSGGQVLKGIAQRAMDLPGDSGTSFYVFEDIDDEKSFKALYRRRLDELPIDDAMAERIVVEANMAFNLNVALFEELDPARLGAVRSESRASAP